PQRCLYQWHDRFQRIQTWAAPSGDGPRLADWMRPCAADSIQMRALLRWVKQAHTDRLEWPLSFDRACHDAHPATRPTRLG
ncbi:hypothetical protein COA18_11865, partial [Priestia megaterium]